MPSLPRRSFAPRKLLVAAIGVATINYAAACGTNNETSGNLPSPPPIDAASEIPPTSGNLPAPPPMDASLDASDAGDASDDASDAGDASDADSG